MLEANSQQPSLVSRYIHQNKKLHAHMHTYTHTSSSFSSLSSSSSSSTPSYTHTNSSSLVAAYNKAKGRMTWQLQVDSRLDLNSL